MPNRLIKDRLEKDVLFEIPMRGEVLASQADISYYTKYRCGSNVLFEGDSIKWLKSIDDNSVDLIFADPPYNIKKAEWDKFDSQETYITWYNRSS